MKDILPPSTYVVKAVIAGFNKMNYIPPKKNNYFKSL